MTVHYSERDGVALLEADNPPVNALGHAVRQGLSEGLARALSTDGVRAVVIACRGRTFFAGADIREFGRPAQAPGLAEVIRALDDANKPVVAAIHGTAFGGGLELALACHYRIARTDAQVGLPEVKLGLLPGAGGTQRLPRLIGAEAAVQMITSGDPMPAPRARELGAVDALSERELLDDAVAFAGRMAAQDGPLPRARDRSCDADDALFDALRQKLQKKRRGYEAPQHCVSAVQAAAELPFDEGMAREAELFRQCMQSPQSAAQRHIFFAERTANKIPDIDRDVQARPVQRVGIIGAGTMGGGIAMACANAGLAVTLLDRDQASVDAGLARIQAQYGSSVKRGRLSQQQCEQRLARISTHTDMARLADADLVIEAAFEDMEVKKQLFAELDRVCQPGAVLATNTSTLDINVIAQSTERPQDVIGLHFFSPANVMRLLEIVRGADTGKDVVQTALKFGKRLGKVGVVVGVCHGFVGNRMLYPYRREASFLVEEGASPAQVDRVVESLGLPMGPFAMGDLAGLDVGWRVRKALGKPEGERYSGTVADRLCEQGHFGQKTGRGYYKYEAGSRKRETYPEVDALIGEVRQELGIQPREVTDDEIRERCLYALINEGARILDEGIALRASDIDTVWVYGYGFPAFLGGPMFHADQLGLDRVLERVRQYAERDPVLWKPAQSLTELASSGGRFNG